MVRARIREDLTVDPCTRLYVDVTGRLMLYYIMSFLADLFYLL